MPTLLQINTVVNSGSTGHIVEEIGQLAIANGWKSYIAYGRNHCSSYSSLIKIGTDFDVKMHGLRTRLFDKHGFGSKQATKILIERIKAIKPDIIHLHNIHGYYLNIETLFKYLAVANIPIVWTLHDCWPITGHCTHFDFVGCNKWKTACYACPQRNEYPASSLIDNSKRNYRDKLKFFCSVKNITIVPVSQWLENVVNESFLKNYPQKRIYNGVDINVFYPLSKSKDIKDKLGVGNRLMLVGVASIWGNRKSLIDYIKLSELIDKNIIIVLVGLSQKQLKNLPDNIIGLPRTENISELVEIYSAAEIVLNLSVEESFGMTTVEGLACGTPGIVYNCTASPELVTFNTGIIVERGNISEILKAISQILNNKKSYYSDACRKEAESSFNNTSQFNEYVELYNKLLQSNS